MSEQNDTLSREASTRAKQLLQSGKLRNAVKLTQAELTSNPTDSELLYIQAVAQRYLGKSKDALVTLATLKKYHANYARAYQEEGHNLKQLGDRKNATVAYQRAVDLNHALLSSWRELVDLYRRENNHRALAMAQAEHSIFRSDPE